MPAFAPARLPLATAGRRPLCISPAAASAAASFALGVIQGLAKLRGNSAKDSFPGQDRLPLHGFGVVATSARGCRVGAAPRRHAAVIEELRHMYRTTSSSPSLRPVAPSPRVQQLPDPEARIVRPARIESGGRLAGAR